MKWLVRIMQKRVLVAVFLVSAISICVPQSAGAIEKPRLESSVLPEVRTSNAQYSDDTVSYRMTDEQAMAAYEYWTEDRLKEAFENRIDTIAEDVEEDGIPSIDAEDDITTTFQPVEPAYPNNGVSTLSGFSPDSSSSPTGLLALTVNGQPATCTASLVNSSSKKLLVTAAHCLHGGKGGGWHGNYMFTPNAGPHGGQQMFPGGVARVFNDWIANANPDDLSASDIANDVGFLTINTSVLPPALVNLVAQYGGHGFGHSNLGSFDATIVGYPANPGNNFIPQSCISKVETAAPFGFGKVLQAKECSFVNGHGASGGPWLQLYDATTGVGWVNSVTSGSPLNSTVLRGPRFDDRVYEMYTTANNDGL